MFLKSSVKVKDGNSYFYYRICESYRDGFQVRNRTLLSVGELRNMLTNNQIMLLNKRLNEIYYEGKDQIFPIFVDEQVERLAHQYTQEIKNAERTRKEKLRSDGIEEVYIDSIKN